MHLHQHEHHRAEHVDACQVPDVEWQQGSAVGRMSLWVEC